MDEIFCNIGSRNLRESQRPPRRRHHAEIRRITGTDHQKSPILLAVESQKVEA